MRHELFWLEQQPRNRIVGVSGTLILVLGLIDYLTGPYLSLIIFYLVPVFLITWCVGRTGGYAACSVTSMIWLLTDTFLVAFYPEPAIMYWNIIVRLLFFLVFVAVIARLQRALQHEKLLSRRDYLTGAMNSRAFYEFMEHEIKRAQRYQTPLTVAYLDVDNFKLINDRFGHSTGDEVLRIVATAIATTIHASDIVARLGGDEFAIGLVGAPEGMAVGLLERIHSTLHGAMHQQGWDVTFSIGVVTFHTLPPAVDELIQTVDELMYVGKQSGKNVIRHATYHGSIV